MIAVTVSRSVATPASASEQRPNGGILRHLQERGVAIPVRLYEGDEPPGVLFSSIRILAETTGLAGAPVEALLAPFGIARAELTLRPERRLAWVDTLRLVDACAAALGREAFLASGPRCVEAIPDVVPFARSFVRPLALMTFVYEVYNRIAFPMLSLRVTAMTPWRFRLEMEADARVPVTPLFWEYLAANNSAMPCYFGHPPSPLRFEVDGHRSVNVIEFPEADEDVEAIEPVAPLLDHTAAQASRRIIDVLGVNIVRLLPVPNVVVEAPAARVDALVERIVSQVTNAAFFVAPGVPPRAANTQGALALARDSGELIQSLRSPDAQRYTVVPLVGSESLVMANVSSRESHARDEVHALRTALAAVGVPLALVDGDGTVIESSAEASVLFAGHDVLSIRAGRLAARRDDDQRRIARALAEIADGVPSISVELATQTEHPLLMVIAALDAGSPRRLLVFWRDPRQDINIDERPFARLYGLTPTEARTAVAIAGGQTTAEIAKSRACAEETVRKHLKIVLEKTGARRQANLVRLVLNSAVALPGLRPPGQPPAALTSN